VPQVGFYYTDIVHVILRSVYWMQDAVIQQYV